MPPLPAILTLPATRCSTLQQTRPLVAGLRVDPNGRRRCAGRARTLRRLVGPLSPIKPAFSSPIGEQRTRIRLGVESMTVARARDVSTALGGRIRSDNPCVVTV